jgi:citrate lyase subunit beta/citryl-CoA lyase
VIRPVGRLRSLLFAPAVRSELVEKAPGLGADGIVIDCEDGTPPGAKDRGRANALQLADRLSAGPVQVFVRVNAVASPWFADDVASGLAEGLHGVLVPKVETLDELDRVAGALTAAGRAHLGVIAGLETALAVADARVLLAHPVVVSAYFGAEDYTADVGGVRTAAGTEVLYARSHIALAARLAGVPVLDQVVPAVRDDVTFLRQAQEARALGYRGKLCLHPSQVALANQAFLPSADEVDRARRLLLAYEEAAGLGLGAIDFEGQVVDEALAAQARQILTAAAPDP